MVTNLFLKLVAELEICDLNSKLVYFLNDVRQLGNDEWLALQSADIDSNLFRDFATRCLRKFRSESVTIDTYSKIGDFKFRLHEWVRGEYFHD